MFWIDAILMLGICAVVFIAFAPALFQPEAYRRHVGLLNGHIPLLPT
jgi:hypothetical protein